MSSIVPGQGAHARQEPGSDHLCGVFVRRPRGAECRKTCGRGVKQTQILGMGSSTPRLALGQEAPACRRNGGTLLVNSGYGLTKPSCPLSRQAVLTYGTGLNQQSHHFLYSGGAFARLYPVNPSPARNHAAKPKRRPLGRGRFALDMWGLVSVPYSRLKAPRM